MTISNFSGGPSALPRKVLARAQVELGQELPLMTQSHRGQPYRTVHDDVRRRLCRILNLSDEWQVLLLQGGASTMFATIPLNFVRPGETADYVLTGVWSEKALAEARRWPETQTHVAAEGRSSNGQGPGAYTFVPPDEALRFSPTPAYVHITTNNTIVGTQFHRTPMAPAPLVADASSDILSRPISHIERYGCIYAGAQKNLGPSGLTIVLIQDSFLEQAREDVPNIFRFSVHAGADSLYHTPPSFAVQLTSWVLEWIEEQGGLLALEVKNRAKADLLYHAIDASDGFYRGMVRPEDRSWMNVTFRLPTPEHDVEFATLAATSGLIGLSGHRSIGGIRASLYNAIEMQDVERLVSFMKSYRNRHRS
ncbi:MAG: 3-phosphoserine/phosphohydroxythreonine transaminase [Myxococcota bacterium]